MMFVGDSLALNQYESLLCMLHAAAGPGVRTSLSPASGKIDPSSTVRFEVHPFLSFTCMLAPCLVRSCRADSIRFDSICRPIDRLGAWFVRYWPCWSGKKLARWLPVGLGIMTWVGRELGATNRARWLPLSVDGAPVAASASLGTSRRVRVPCAPAPAPGWWHTGTYGTRLGAPSTNCCNSLGARAPGGRGRGRGFAGTGGGAISPGPDGNPRWGGGVGDGGGRATAAAAQVNRKEKRGGPPDARSSPHDSGLVPAWHWHWQP